MNNIDAMQAAQAECDAALAVLDANKEAWVATTVEERIRLIEEIKDCLMTVSKDWSEKAAFKKGIDANSPLAGEEWISGPQAMMAYCNSMILTLRDVKGRRHLKSVPLRKLPNGQLAARVFPQTIWDKLLLSGVTADVWMQPGVTPQNLHDGVASQYNREQPPRALVSLVLGAGNISSIAPLDCLQKLFVDNQVAILKLNPVNEFLTDYLEPAFAPLIERGFLKIVRGDILVGQYLCKHKLVNVIHITGSGTAHEEIVWGVGQQAKKNRDLGVPINSRPITSELGCVAPTIVVPGPWSRADIAFQAEHVATQKLHNSGFNCIACQVLMLPSNWQFKGAFLKKLRQVIAASEPRPIYYPLSQARLGQFQSATTGVTDKLLKTANKCLVAMFKPKQNHPFETVEVFGPALGVMEMQAKDAESFLIEAIAYANKNLEGTLGANVIIHPVTMEKIGRKRFEEIISELRYGCVGVNAWTGVGFLLPTVTWGAYPGHTLEKVGSGIGFVHNTMMFERAQRTVVEGPFRPFPRNLLSLGFTLLPKPPWFITNKRAHVVGKLLVSFHHRPSLLKLPRIFLNALRG